MNDQHEHVPLEDGSMRPNRYELLGRAVRELLIERGIITAEEERMAIEAMDMRTPHNGARVVARAWSDLSYKKRLLEDGTSAVEELGIQVSPTILKVIENTLSVHNLIVCTLCSCYPRMLLGLPPDWYKSRPYRSRAVSEPRSILAEFGTDIGDDVEVRVHDSTADLRYMVLPLRPQGTTGMKEAELVDLVTRDSMIGVAHVKGPTVSVK